VNLDVIISKLPRKYQDYIVRGQLPSPQDIPAESFFSQQSEDLYFDFWSGHSMAILEVYSSLKGGEGSDGIYFHDNVKKFTIFPPCIYKLQLTL
jgi:hypothetical protein